MKLTTYLLITTNLIHFVLNLAYFNNQFAMFDLLWTFAYALIQKYKPAIAYNFWLSGVVIYTVIDLIFIVTK